MFSIIMSCQVHSRAKLIAIYLQHNLSKLNTVDCSSECVFCLLHIGAQIIDMMLLVVDATKGMQTQTAEVCNLCI